MGKITAISTALPKYKYNQLEIFESIKLLHASTSKEERILKYLYSNSGIDVRYSALPDFNVNQDTTLRKGSTFLTVNERLDIYTIEAFKLAKKIVEGIINKGIDVNTITHVISISCTGMCAPGLDLMLVEAFQLRKNIKRTSINFMGCYAALHGMKFANDIVNANVDAKVLLVDVELCTLHFQPDKTIDNIVSTILFGDGAAACIIEANCSNNKGWLMHDFYSEILLEGKKEMRWNISTSGFLMTLTNEVPKLIEKNIESFTNNALIQYKLSKQDIAYWCIHPGGKKIIEAMQKGLHLNDAECTYSFQILKNYGNMSSPTVLFVLDLITKSIDVTNNTKTMMNAFGPGLTLETALLEYE